MVLQLWLQWDHCEGHRQQEISHFLPLIYVLRAIWDSIGHIPIEARAEVFQGRRISIPSQDSPGGP